MSKIDWRFLKDEENITTDSLWITSTQRNGKFYLPRRELFKDFHTGFHGLFIPEIPYQMIKRFTKPGDKIWDCFAGGGTTNYVAEKLGRKDDVLSTDLIPTSNFITYANVLQKDPLLSYKRSKCTASINFLTELSFKLIFFHPPYHNIVRFSSMANDLSNFDTLDLFLKNIETAVQNVVPYLQARGILILVCGNIWYQNEEIDLGVQIKELFRKEGLKSKAHIVKDYGETKAGIFGRGYNLQYYRNLKNNTNFFYGDNIFILQK